MPDVANDGRNFRGTDDIAIWREIEASFEDLRIAVTLTRFETEEEFVGRDNERGKWSSTTPLWDDASFLGFDEEADASGDYVGIASPAVRPWLLIPYIVALDHKDLTERRDAAAAMVGDLEGAIARRELTPRFMSGWGLFCELAGSVNLIWMSNPDDPRALRDAIARQTRQTRQRKRWVALQLRELEANGIRGKRAIKKIVDRIQTILLAGRFDGQFGREWYDALLSKKKSGVELVTSYDPLTKFKKSDRDVLATNQEIEIPPLP